MKEINAQNLETVSGGSKKSDALNNTLLSVQSSIKDLAANQNNSGSSSTTTMLFLAMAMQNRNQTVVAAPACSGCSTTYVSGGPSFRFRARFRF